MRLHSVATASNSTTEQSIPAEHDSLTAVDDVEHGCVQCHPAVGFREVPLCWYQGCAKNCRYFCELCVLVSPAQESDAVFTPESDPQRWFHFQEEGECPECAGTGLGTSDHPACGRCKGSGHCPHTLKAEPPNGATRRDPG